MTKEDTNKKKKKEIKKVIKQSSRDLSNRAYASIASMGKQAYIKRNCR